MEPASFPRPDPGSVADAAAARLLFDAARLGLRSGAAPFRSLGHISVHPRPYQFVPLIMALRLDPVRLPGICVFVDGSAHRAPAQAEHDRQLRGALRDRGYRVVELSCAGDLRSQLAAHPDVFH